jgi:hypothetical protein
MIKRGSFITSSEKISAGTGVPRGTVERILKYLENEVMIEEVTTHRFRLISVVNYDKYQNSEEVNEEQVRSKRGTSEEQVDTNKNDKNVKNDKKTILTSEPSSQVKEVMNVFYKINPTLNWGNKTTRKACEDMIRRFGFEETKRMAEAVISVQGRPYAPRATTPYQMKEKLAAFKIYFDSERNKQKDAIPKFTKIS